MHKFHLYPHHFIRIFTFIQCLSNLSDKSNDWLNAKHDSRINLIKWKQKHWKFSFKINLKFCNLERDSGLEWLLFWINTSDILWLMHRSRNQETLKFVSHSVFQGQGVHLAWKIKHHLANNLTYIHPNGLRKFSGSVKKFIIYILHSLSDLTFSYVIELLSI